MLGDGLGGCGAAPVLSTGGMEHVVLLRSAVTLLGRFPALAGVDLTVEPGEVVLLRWANGAGKSTGGL